MPNLKKKEKKRVFSVLNVTVKKKKKKKSINWLLFSKLLLYKLWIIILQSKIYYENVFLDNNYF
jgi:hypothetical protein